MRRTIDRALVALCLVSTVTIVGMLTLILGNVLLNGWGRLSWEFLTSAPANGISEGGIFPAIYGTVLLVLIMSVAAVPFGVLVAIYLSEYARRDSILYRATRVAVSNLAGVPSIVFGLFGLGFFIQTVGRAMDQTLYGGQRVYGQPSILWAAMTMAVLTLPVVIVTVEESLRSVPREYREASLALGATRLQTIFRVVLPQSWAGVMTGTILAVSRGAGEVAPVLFTGVAFLLPYRGALPPPSAAYEQFMQLGNHVYVLSTQSPNVEETKPILYSTVLVLLALTFLLNLTAIVIRKRIRAWATI